MLDKIGIKYYNIIKLREKLKAERNRTMNMKEYKEMLIQDILEYQTRKQFTKEELEKKPVRILEKIYDNVD